MVQNAEQEIYGEPAEVERPPVPALLEADSAKGWRALAFCSTEAARRLLPFKLAEKLEILPLGVVSEGQGEAVTILIADNAPQSVLSEARFALGLPVVAERANAEHVEKAIRAAYLGQGDSLKQAAEIARQTAGQTASPENVAATNSAAAANAPIPQLLERLVDRALYLGASDIHLEPGTSQVRLRYRVNGRLEEEKLGALSPAAYNALLRRAIVLANLPSQAPDEPCEGGFSLMLGSEEVRLRLSTLPCLQGQKAVFRLLPQSKNREPGVFADYLGLSAVQKRLLLAGISAERGMILLSGPTGSGKSTLLYALLAALNEESRNIITLEDPVERSIAGLVQVQASPESGLSFETLLPKILRQDPDVLMVGEIRNSLTAKAAVEAAISGCLVLSTIHAGSALEIFLRLAQLNVETAYLAEAMQLLGSQRLLARCCKNCREKIRPNERLSRLFALAPGTTLVRGRGCSACRNTGISGRLPVYEFLPVTPALRARLRRAAGLSQPLTPEVLERAAADAGFRPFAYDIREALIAEAITPTEALRALGLPQELAG